MYTVLIVGAGYLGSQLARHFADEKQKVYALTRTQARRDELEKAGVQTLVADLTRPETLREALPAAHFIVLCPAPDEPDEASYQHIYGAGIANVLQVLRARPFPRLLVYISSTRVWGKQVCGWVDESTPPAPGDEKGRIMVRAEESVLNAGLPAVVFRLTGLYGPGRNRIDPLRDGAWPQPGPDRYMNMIHCDDVVGAMRLIFNRAVAGRVYLGVDHEPTLKSEVYRWLAGRMQLALREGVLTSGTETGKQCRNTKLKDLGYVFRYPSFRVGYEDLLSHS
ncbi:MAG: SDR family oxidoreductase [Candidatus Omnitrophota bacterium]|jgi:nucleoside-diphosphate-sugar epimerase